LLTTELPTAILASSILATTVLLASVLTATVLLPGHAAMLLLDSPRNAVLLSGHAAALPISFRAAPRLAAKRVLTVLGATETPGVIVEVLVAVPTTGVALVSKIRILVVPPASELATAVLLAAAISISGGLPLTLLGPIALRTVAAIGFVSLRLSPTIPAAVSTVLTSALSFPLPIRLVATESSIRHFRNLLQLCVGSASIAPIRQAATDVPRHRLWRANLFDLVVVFFSGRGDE
jgi:hypothetical protein